MLTKITLVTGLALAAGIATQSAAQESWTMTTTWPSSLELIEIDKHFVELANKLTGDALTEHWNEKVAYCNDVRNQMKDFFDQDKVDALCDKVKSVKINA